MNDTTASDSDASEETRLQELLDRWEEHRQRGETVSAESLCADCPHLKPELERRIRRLQAMNGFLEAKPAATPDTGDAVDFAAGPYRAFRLHAKGGLGEIYLARDRSLNRDVALKRMQVQFLSQEDVRKRFEMEAEITGRLEHPGVIPIYAFGIDDKGHPFYAMRFVDGETLEDASLRLHEHRTDRSPGVDSLQFQKLLQAFLAACQAVAYAHSRGVVHRDIKPANLMLGGYGETLVVDWGLAKPVSESSETTSAVVDETILFLESADSLNQTIPGSAKGSPTYMSPEQARGDTAMMGARSDVYSLGATLYHLLVGRGPVRGQTLSEILQNVRLGCFPRPTELNRHCPKALEAVCLKAMSLEPEDRYPSATELAEDVSRWLADEPVSAWTEPVATRIRRWMKRQRALVATIAAVAVMVFLGLGVISVLQHRNNRQIEDLYERERAAKETALNKEREAKRETQRAENHLYDRQMNLAYRYWRDGNGVMTDLLLKRMPENLRRFMWDLLRHEVDHDPTFYGHSAPVRFVAVSSDGKKIASASYDGTARIWDTEDRENSVVLQMKGAKALFCVEFLQQDQYLATASYDKTVRFWSVKTGQLLDKMTLTDHTSVVTSVAVSGRYLATGGDDHTVCVYDLQEFPQETPKRIARLTYPEGQGNNVHSLAFSPDGTLLAAGGKDKTIRVWSLEQIKALQDKNMAGDDLKEKQSLPPVVLEADFPGHKEIYPIAFSPNGRYLAAAGTDHRLMIYDVARVKRAALAVPGKTQRRPIIRPTKALKGHKHEIYGLAFADDRHVASGDMMGTVILWDLEKTGDESLQTIQAHSGSIFGLQFRNWKGVADPKLNDLQLVTGSADYTVRIWERVKQKSGEFLYQPQSRIRLEDNRIAKTFDGEVVAFRAHVGPNGRPAAVRAICFAPKDRWMATSGDDGTVRIWDPMTWKLLGELKIDVGRVPVAGKIDGTFPIWDSRIWKGLGDLTIGIVKPSEQVQVTCLAVSPDGSLPAAGTGDWTNTNSPGHFLVWRIQRHEDRIAHRELISRRGHEVCINDLAFSPDGKRLATASHDQTVKIWQVLPVDGGKQPTVLAGGHEHWVWQTAFVQRSGGDLLVSGGHDGRILLWNLETLDAPPPLGGHTSAVASMAFHPLMPIFVTGGFDNQIIIHAFSDGKTLPADHRYLRGHTSPVWSVDFSRKGRILASGSWDGVVRLWRINPDRMTGREVATLDPNNRFRRIWAADQPDNRSAHKRAAGKVFTVRFSRNGKTLLAGTENGWVHVWSTINRNQPAKNDRR